MKPCYCVVFRVPGKGRSSYWLLAEEDAGRFSARGFPSKRSVENYFRELYASPMHRGQGASVTLHAIEFDPAIVAGQTTESLLPVLASQEVFEINGSSWGCFAYKLKAKPGKKLHSSGTSGLGVLLPKTRKAA